jgi:hypothetical protein
VTLSWYELSFPGDLDSEGVVHFVRTLAVRPRRGALRTALPVICDVEGHDGHLVWRLGVASSDEKRILTSLRQALPEVQAEVVPAPNVAFDAVWELRLSARRRVLKHDSPDQVAGSVLSGLLTAGRTPLMLLYLSSRWFDDSGSPIGEPILVASSKVSVMDECSFEL